MPPKMPPPKAPPPKAPRQTLAHQTLPRLGPRPLPLHLGTEFGTWMSLKLALPALRQGWPGWKPELGLRARALQPALAAVEAQALTRALDRLGRAEAVRFLQGIEAYRRHPYRRRPAAVPEFWRQGSTRLLDYGARDLRARHGRPVLVVPSLVNRGYVLDLEGRRSLLRYLASRGLRPFLVDWDSPGPEERGFDLSAYIAGPLAAALDAVRAADGRRPVVMGYCMGGLLALALAGRRQEDVAGLACLATPWDFHHDGGAQAARLVRLAPAVTRLANQIGVLPVAMVQALFHSLDPYLVGRKFRRFAELDAGDERARAFVALEDWLNDGVPLAAPVARECLEDWYGRNLPATGGWRVAGAPVRPRALRVPSLVVIPEQDTIVPPASARALAEALPGCATLTPRAGHVGMVVGSRALTDLWRPLAGWLAAREG